MSAVLEQLKQQAVQLSERIALHNGAQALSYAALWTAVHRLRQAIIAGNHSVIALAGDNSLAWIVADLAMLGLPVRIIPVPGFFSVDQVQHIFRQAQVDAVITTSAESALIPGVNPVQWRLLDADLDLVVGHLPSAGRYDGEYEKVTFTSGSTGSPKGVRLSLATLENTAQAIGSTLADQGIESHLSVLPYATLLENCAGIYAPLLQGVTIHVRGMAELGLQSPAQFNPLLLAMTIQAVIPQATILVPQLLLALVTLTQRGILAQQAFRFIAVGGGKVSIQLLATADQLGLPVFEGYGLSECGSVVTLNTPTARKSGSVGKVLPHAQLSIDEAGEIQVSGAVMKGYLGEPDVTGNVVGTGDLGSIDGDGFVRVSGRKKNLFITAFGRNVNPEWLEAELLCQLPIAQVAVFGEALPMNIAIVVPRQGFSQLAVETAIQQCNQTLPDYARIGRIIIAEQSFTDANGMATPNGRVRRAIVAEHYATQLSLEVDDGIFPTTTATN